MLALLLLLLAACTAQAQALDDAQRDWLQRIGPVRFAPERDYPPFVFQREDGRLDGLSVQLLHEVQRRTGLQLALLPARPLAEQLALARERRADLLSSLRPTPERAAFLLFTEPYVRVPALLVVRGGAPSPPTLDQMAGRRVAVGAGYAVESVVRGRHPAVAWQPVADDGVALRGVADGRFDAAVTDAASLAHLRRGGALGTLAVAGHVAFEYELAFAVRSDWPQLRDIVDAGLRAIPVAERRALVERWIPEAELDALAPPRAPVATFVGGLLAAAGLVLLLWMVWRRR